MSAPSARPGSVPLIPCCPQCQNPFRGLGSSDPGARPVLFACGHTTCLACGEAQAIAIKCDRNAAAQGITAGSASCPVCRECVGDSGDFNAPLAALAEAAYQHAHGPPPTVDCVDCLNMDISEPAVSVCIGCAGVDRPLCSDHAIPHRKRKHSTLIPIEKCNSHAKMTQISSKSAVMCPTHPDSKLTRFCFTDNTAVCAECCLATATHPLGSHDVKMVEEASAELGSKLLKLERGARAAATKASKDAAYVQSCSASMREGFEASKEEFIAHIDTIIAQLIKHRDEVILKGTTACESRQKSLKYQANQLQISAAQLRLAVDVYKATDPSNPPALAAVYATTRKTVTGLTRNPFRIVVHPLVTIGFDEQVIGTAVKYGAWIEQGQRLVDPALDADKAKLTSVIRSCAAEATSVAEGLASVKVASGDLPSRFSAFRTALTAKAERVTNALEIAVTEALQEADALTQSRIVALDEQQKSLAVGSAALSVAAGVGVAALASNDPKRIAESIEAADAAFETYESIYDGIAVPLTLDVVFDEAAVLENIDVEVRRHDIDFTKCEVSGPGVQQFTQEEDYAESQNTFTLVCKDERGDIVPYVCLSDVSIEISTGAEADDSEIAAAGGAGVDHVVVGAAVSLTRVEPGIFKCVYMIDNDDVKTVEVDVRVYGEASAGSPITVSRSLFPGSTVLPCVPSTILQQFNGGIKSWLQPSSAAQKPVLLFRMSRDGSATSDFHSRCDGKASTVTLIKSNNGYVFGGYAGAAWSTSLTYNHYGSNYYIHCSQSFIFTVSNPHNLPPTRYAVNYPQNALYGYAANGPNFGGGGLSVGAGDNSLTSQGSTNFSHYNDTTGKGNITFTGSFNFIATEVEVWQVPIA